MGWHMALFLFFYCAGRLARRHQFLGHGSPGNAGTDTRPEDPKSPPRELVDDRPSGTGSAILMLWVSCWISPKNQRRSNSERVEVQACQNLKMCIRAGIKHARESVPESAGPAHFQVLMSARGFPVAQIRCSDRGALLIGNDRMCAHDSTVPEAIITLRLYPNMSESTYAHCEHA